MDDRTEAKLIFEMAQKDFKALCAMLDIETFADEIFGFHAQQAVEKGLKAWISSLGIEFPITHKIENLLKVLQENGASIDPFIDCTELNDFAVRYRYSDYEMYEDTIDRHDLIEQVKTLLEHVKSIID